jgi:hypothetical protein
MKNINPSLFLTRKDISIALYKYLNFSNKNKEIMQEKNIDNEILVNILPLSDPLNIKTYAKNIVIQKFEISTTNKDIVLDKITVNSIENFNISYLDKIKLIHKTIY